MGRTDEHRERLDDEVAPICPAAQHIYDDNYDRAGKPSIHAIAKVLGYAVTVPERDKSLAMIMKAGKTPVLEAAEGAPAAPRGNLNFKRPSAAEKESLLKAAQIKDAAKQKTDADARFKNGGEAPARIEAASEAEEHDPSTDGAVET